MFPFNATSLSKHGIAQQTIAYYRGIDRLENPSVSMEMTVIGNIWKPGLSLLHESDMVFLLYRENTSW